MSVHQYCRIGLLAALAMVILGPAKAQSQGVVLKTFTRGIPQPYSLAVSPGGGYGDYLYVSSRQSDIYRIAPDGTVEYFTTKPSGTSYITRIFFDTTADQHYGGAMYVALDYNGGSPCQGGIDKVLPDGTWVTVVNGCATSPGLYGVWDGVIDDQGRFGGSMLVADFEWDNNGSPSNIARVSPTGSVSPFDSARLIGIFGLDLDRYGNFGGDLVASNSSQSPWWLGDRGIYRIAPDGSRTRIIPDQGVGIPRDVLIDAVGRFNGDLFVTYDGGLIVEFNGSGQEVQRFTLPGISSNSLGQDRWGAFGHDLFYAATGLNEVRRIVTADELQERCNGVDDNGDGVVDEGFDVGMPCTAGVGACQRTGTTVCAADGASTVCNAVAGEPSAEVCNGIDDDCDGVVPADEVDNDHDGVMVCAGDCDDSDCSVYPGAVERYDGVDNNCDGVVDEGTDADGDGIPDFKDACPGTPAGTGVDSNGCTVCLPDPDDDGDGYPASADCDDHNAAVHPGALEVCNDVDDNCNGVVDEGFDADGDGYRDAALCPTVPGALDCNDSDASIHPGALELPGNSVDENCDGSLGDCDPISGPDGQGWSNHGEYVRCVANEVDALVAAQELTTEQGDALVQSASQSDVGRNK